MTELELKPDLSDSKLLMVTTMPYCVDTQRAHEILRLRIHRLGHNTLRQIHNRLKTNLKHVDFYFGLNLLNIWINESKPRRKASLITTIDEHLHSVSHFNRYLHIACHIWFSCFNKTYYQLPHVSLHTYPPIFLYAEQNWDSGKSNDSIRVIWWITWGFLFSVTLQQIWSHD